MPPPLVPDDPGLLASILDTATLGGSAVRNVLKGNLGGAGRNLLDMQGRTLDSLLPGDWISDLSSPEDRPEFRDVVDLGGDNLLTDTLNFAGDVLTDPVSYIPGAAIAKAGQLGAKGAGWAGRQSLKVLPKNLREPVASGIKRKAIEAGEKVRATFGAQRVSPGTTAAVAAKDAASGLVGRAGSEGAVDALSGLTERELSALGEAGHNMRLDPVTGRPTRVLDESGTLGFDDRLKKLVAEEPSLDPARLLAAAPKAREAFKAQWDSGLAPASEPGGGIFFERPQNPEALMPGAETAPGVRDYFPRQFSGLKEDEIDLVTGLPKNLGQAPDLAGIPTPAKGRDDWKPQDILDYLTKNPNVNLEFNAAKAMAGRASAQGELAGRAQIGQSLFDMAKAGQVAIPDDLVGKMLPKAKGTTLDDGVELPWTKPGYDPWANAPEPGPTGIIEKPKISDMDRDMVRQYVAQQPFKYADPDLRSAAQSIAKQFPAEEARVLLDALDGLAPRGGATAMLAKLNPYFKGPAVYGAVLPKLGSIMRNGTGGLFQQMANAEARGDVPRAAMALIPNWLKSIEDGVEHLFGARFSKNEFAEVNNAYKLSGGDPRKVASAIQDPIMREAVQRGVLGNNFIDTEAMVKAASAGGWKAFGKKLWEYPAVMFKGMEQRMRYGLYKSLRAKGVPEDKAAQTVLDTFFDYRISSTENRLARDLIPFFQFTAKAIPQQGKFLLENPRIPGTPLRPALSGFANLAGGSNGEPLPPFMEGKVNIPIGQDEQGNQQVISNLGLPMEALGWLPNPSADLSQFGRQFEQNQVGSMHPLLKTAFAVTSGEDPYFGTPYGSYSKVAGVDMGKPGAAINQLLGTGLPGASAISGLLGFGSKTTDDRTSVADKAINLLTGAKITSIDPDVALRQKLQQYLENNPDVKQFRTFYETDETSDGQALIRDLMEARKRIKAKREALVPVN